MNATVEDLLNTIGEQTVEIRILRKQINDLGGKLAEVSGELEAEKAKNKDKTEDKKEK